MAFNIFATATSDIPLANLDANFTMIGSSAVASTLYPTATTSITYGTAGTSHIFSGSIGAFTLGGTVAGGGNQLNNVIIGTSSPLAGAFTTLSADNNTVLASGGVVRTVQIGSLTPPTTVGVLQHVFNGAAAWGGQSTVGGETDFGWNFYYNGGFKSRLADVASRLSFNATSGRVSFWTAPSPGSADAALTFTEALRIDATTGVTALGAMTVGNGLAVTGTLSATGLITSTLTSGEAFKIGSSTAGTGILYMSMFNTSGGLYLGLEGSAGGTLWTGIPAYATGLGARTTGGGISFSANSTAQHMLLTTSGLAVTGTLSATGALTAPSSYSWTAANTPIVVGLSALNYNSSGIYSKYSFNAYHNGTNDVYMSGSSYGATQILSYSPGTGNLKIQTAVAGTGTITWVDTAVFSPTGLAVTGTLSVPSGSNIYLDGGSDTYFQEVSANIARVVTAGSESIRFASTYAQVAGSIGIGGTTPSSGTGITFPATQSASTDANTLDDYEEGTWTPTQGAGLTVVGAFSSSGRYTKIGRSVSISGRIAGATSIATTAGTVMMGAIPFSIAELTAVGTMANGSLNVLGGVGAFGTTAYSLTTIGATSVIDFSLTYSV